MSTHHGGSCNGYHIGPCPGVYRICRGCGGSYVAGAGWPNDFYCGVSCCAVRREELRKAPEECGEDQ